MNRNLTTNDINNMSLDELKETVESFDSEFKKLRNPVDKAYAGNVMFIAKQRIAELGSTLPESEYRHNKTASAVLDKKPTKNRSTISIEQAAKKMKITF